MRSAHLTMHLVSSLWPAASSSPQALALVALHKQQLTWRDLCALPGGQRRESAPGACSPGPREVPSEHPCNTAQQLTTVPPPHCMFAELNGQPTLTATAPDKGEVLHMQGAACSQVSCTIACI